ncbi:hypothetical protein F0726_02337 [Acidithiobacillus caldus]|nr:hypothetical protein F0726_02337 [Acidithiobacillus caldus]
MRHHSVSWERFITLKPVVNFLNDKFFDAEVFFQVKI